MRHMLCSETSRAAILEPNPVVQVADVWLAITHRGDSTAGTSPYTMRFWLVPVHKTLRWLLIAHIAAAADPSSAIVF